jgi:hypothetical protein
MAKCANGGSVLIVHEIESMIGGVFWVRTDYRDIERVILSDIPQRPTADDKALNSITAGCVEFARCANRN